MCQVLVLTHLSCLFAAGNNTNGSSNDDGLVIQDDIGQRVRP